MKDFSKEDYTSLLKALKRVRSKKLWWGLGIGSDKGLCTHLLWVDRNLLHSLFRSWEKYSGNSIFPVPDPEGLSHSFKYNITTNKFALYTKYGRLRWKLVDHMINECERILKEEW